MDKISCIVVDDEPLALGLMESYVRKTPFLEMKGAFPSAVEAMGFLRSQKVDLIFLDIQMPQLNGLEFSRLVGASTRIVFVTAFDKYALDGYKVNALDYLLKPVSYADFLEAADRALEWFSRGTAETAARRPGYIFVKSEYRYLQVRLDEILYAEGLKDYVKIWLEGSDEPVLSLMSMKSLEEMLPKEEFMRVHRSFIVRKDKVRVVERGRIVFGKRLVPVGDSYLEEFRKFLSAGMQ